MTSLGERLKKLREEKELTLEYVANKCGTTQVSISRYEKNQREPKSEMLKFLSKFYNVSTDYLLGVTDIKKPSLENKKEEQNSLTDDEKNILNLYKKLNDKDKAKFEGMMELKISEYKDEYKNDKKIISSTCPNIEEDIS